ncbi:urease accessory protein UreF [Szabonella alba]|uniref:Urease accessory protein UreF n=1 Tax=Szabonella alba TaxID=2804194 RepID=A0A8K0VC88_9RHOB|nr:urease accessory UreF family protein [Szabonella alba]MBL4917099.1 urease accessory protein UreF [Szabonella alba]
MIAVPSPPKASPGASLLAFQQWLSPAFPTGGFAYSQGMEGPMAARELRDAAGVGDYLADILRFGSGRVDATLLCHAALGDSDADALADLALALAPTAERLREIREIGAAITALTNALNGTAHPPRPHAVALGVAARGLDLPGAQLAAMFLQAQATTLVSAATRFIPLGQTEAQLALARLAPLILDLADEAARTPLEAIGSATFRADLASAAHETLDVRIFRT